MPLPLFHAFHRVGHPVGSTPCGQVWEKGFRMVIAYNTGNEMREATALMLAENIMPLNPKFEIEGRNVEWKGYLVQYRSYMYPIFITGWVADYADPHNFLYTFMHSQGAYGWSDAGAVPMGNVACFSLKNGI